MIELESAWPDKQEGIRVPQGTLRYWIPMVAALIVIFLAFAAFFMVLLYVPLKPHVTQGNLTDGALLGDTFNILSTLFSGLAFAILIGTLVYQRHDIAASDRRLEAALQHQASLAATARRELEENTLQMRASMFAVSEQSFVAMDRSVANTPSVLRKFHGISRADLRRAGVTADELSYLIAILGAGGIHIKATAIRNPDAIDSGPFLPGSWYHTLLSSPHVQRSWKIMGHTFADSVYKTKIEATLALIRKSDQMNG